MKKIIALFLAIVMTIALVPSMVGYTDKENASVNVGEWLSLVNSEFGMSYYENNEPYFKNITSDNMYFAAVQTAVEWDVISADDNIDVYAAVKTDFMAATLVKAAKLTSNPLVIKNADKLYSPDAVAIAAGNGIVSLEKNGTLRNLKITLTEGRNALAIAKNLWATRSFNDEKANVKVNDNVREINDLVSTDSHDKYKVEKEDDGTEVVVLPVTQSTTSLSKGDVVVLPATSQNPFGAVKKVDDVTKTDESVEVKCEEAQIDEVFEDINLESAFAPDFKTAQITDNNGQVINQADATAAEGFSIEDSGIATTADQTVMMSLLQNKDASQLMQCAAKNNKPVDVNLSVGDYSIAGKIDGDKMDFSVSGVVKGVKVTKTYNFTNFNLSTKADVDVKKSNIKEAYIRVDYDVVDSTKVEGNYNTALAQYNWGKEAKMSDVDKALGTNVYGSLQSAADSVAANINNTFKIASVEIPIPNMPVVSVALDISLRINIDGSIELVVETNNSRGYEIINNQGRVISNTINKENTVNLGANCQLTANFGLALKLVGLTVVDAGVETGVGADTQASITWFTAKDKPQDTVTADIPIEVALTLTSGQTYCNVTGDVTIYGILRVSVGQNSPILKAVGLCKTWDIFNEDNAVIYKYHFDEGNVPQAPVETETSKEADETVTTVTQQEAKPVVTPSETISLKAGETLSLADKGSNFTSSDSAKVAVSENSVVTAVAGGSAIITGTQADGSAVSYKISVIDPEVTEAQVIVVSAFQYAPVSYSI